MCVEGSSGVGRGIGCADASGIAKIVASLKQELPVTWGPGLEDPLRHFP